METKQQLDALLELEVDDDADEVLHSPFSRLKTDAGAISLKSVLTEVEKLKDADKGRAS